MTGAAMVDGKTTAEIVDELEKAAVALESASNRLYHATRSFEGYWSEETDPETHALKKVWEPGPNLRWRIAVSEAIEEIATEKFSDTRAPGRRALGAHG